MLCGLGALSGTLREGTPIDPSALTWSDVTVASWLL